MAQVFCGLPSMLLYMYYDSLMIHSTRDFPLNLAYSKLMHVSAADTWTRSKSAYDSRLQSLEHVLEF